MQVLQTFWITSHWFVINLILISGENIYFLWRNPSLPNMRIASDLYGRIDDTIWKKNITKTFQEKDIFQIGGKVAIKTNEFNLIKENTFLDWWSQLIKCVQPSGSFLLLKVMASVRKSKNLRIFSEKSKSSNNLSSTILGNVRWREIKDTFQDFSSQDLIFSKTTPHLYSASVALLFSSDYTILNLNKVFT